LREGRLQFCRRLVSTYTETAGEFEGKGEKLIASEENAVDEAIRRKKGSA